MVKSQGPLNGDYGPALFCTFIICLDYPNDPLRQILLYYQSQVRR